VVTTVLEAPDEGLDRFFVSNPPQRFGSTVPRLPFGFIHSLGKRFNGRFTDRGQGKRGLFTDRFVKIRKRLDQGLDSPGILGLSQ
jgi:hypothetical protein